MKGVDQRAVSVGTSPVTLCAVNPARLGVMVGCPLGVAGAWVALMWNRNPSGTEGIPLFFGERPLILHEDDYG